MSVDLTAPNGGRIVLRPVVAVERLPGMSRGALAAVVAICAIFLLTSTNRLNHTDLWGHLSFGRWIVEHGSLPTADPFRVDTVEHFVNVPWLAQVLGYACHQTLGLEGLVLAHAGSVALTALVLILAVRARGVDAGWGAVAAVAAYVLALPIVGTIRPQLFGMVGFALTLYGVALLPTRRSVLLWLPLVFALWANLHGSFPMGLIVLGCFAMGETWAAFRTRKNRFAGEQARWFNGPRTTARRAWLAMLLAFFAVCLNPCGIQLLGAVAGFSGNTNLEGISEWRPMVLKSFSGVLFYGSLLVTAILLRWSPRRVSVTEAFLLLAFGLIALTAIRMLVWWALVLPWIAAPHAAALGVRRFSQNAPRDESCGDVPCVETGANVVRVKANATPAGVCRLEVGSTRAGSEQDGSSGPAGPRRLLFALVTIGLTLWWSPPTHALCTGRSRDPRQVLSTGTPKELADWMCLRRIHGRIFAPMDWADYLIWRTDGAIEPLVYSHVHLISSQVWQDFLEIDQGSPSWSAIAERHGLRYLIASRRRNTPLIRNAARSHRCQVQHETRQALLLQILNHKTNNSPAPTSPQRPSSSEKHQTLPP